MNIVVSFEIAKTLKEKGFDEPTLFCYRGKFDVYCHSLGGYLSEMTQKSNSELDNYEINKTKQYWVSAPTIAEVVMWLYEKHGIWVKVFDVIKDNKKSFIWSLSNDWSKAGWETYNSPTEAYSAAIEYVLNNLI